MKGDKKKRSVHIPVTTGGKGKDKTKKPASPGREDEVNEEPLPEENAGVPEGKARNYDELLDTLQRLKAEYANYQKRTDREREEWHQQYLREIFLKILPVVDNLERATAAATRHSGAEELRSGIELVLKGFHQVLEASGEKFDPRFHDAVMMEETDKLPPETVVSEVLSGYMIGDRVLRAAKVTVSRRPQEPPAAE